MNPHVLSVIIPVYNAEKHIVDALSSVLSQTGEETEIILIDDGSQDRSLEICRDLARKDQRIQVISQKNGGPGAARNAGLRIARGKYIQFVDSDDTVTDGAVDSLMKGIQGNDLAIAHFNILRNGQALDRGYIQGEQNLRREDFLQALAKRPGSYYYSALWNKLYLREIIRENGLQFDCRLHWGEDFAFNMQYYGYIDRVGFVAKPVYNYRRSLKGQTWRTMFTFGKSVAIKAQLYRTLKALYVRYGAFERYRLHIYRYVFNVTLSS